MKKNIGDKIKKIFVEDTDLSTQEFIAGDKKIFIYFIPSLIDMQILSDGVLEQIKIYGLENGNKTTIIGLGGKIKPYNLLIENNKKQIKNAVDEILKGAVAVTCTNDENILIIPMNGAEKRAIQEPPTAAVVKGPREGFVEDINVNLGLIRKRLKTPNFSVVKEIIGERTNTEVAICYIDDIADKAVVKEIISKLKNIKIDAILDSYYIQSILESRSNTTFKQVGNTEKPDIAVAKMLEGRIAIIVDGSPMVLTVPFIFIESLQNADDYYTFPAKASYVRIIRFLGLIIAISLPGIYVAMQSYHYKVLPINFLLSLMSSIQGISFPPILEILFVLFLFEILNEASIRMPKYLGMALSIIGALILGNTAVEAGIITSPSIVVVAISGITLYIVPDQANECGLLRTLFTIAGGVAGFFGIILCFMILTTYLADITCFKAPYLAPYAPVIPQDKKDAIFKQDLIDMTDRPKSISNKNKVRIKMK